MVKVSVIIPAYNGDRFLAAAINSVLQQTYGDYEIIVVDDGSTDNTAQIVQQYCPKVRYFPQANQGVAASRNLGLAAAMGDYIVFLDQDDVLLPHKLSDQAALLDRHPHLGIVNSGWQIFQSDRQNTAPTTQATVEPWHHIPHLSSANLIIWKPVFLGAMMFRRTWLERVGGFDTALEQTPDVDLVLRLAQIDCPAAWVKEVTVQYRQHEANASKNALLQARELNQITASFFAQPNLSPEIKNLEAQSRYQSSIWAAWRLYETGYINQMRDYLAESQAYSDQYPSQIPLDWIASFKNYAAEYGNQLDVQTLISSPEWLALIRQCLAIA
ncbi:MAG: glycosyltransferase family A protein [Cyanobacteria bacterium P01_C01_bin.72]